MMLRLVVVSKHIAQSKIQNSLKYFSLVSAVDGHSNNHNASVSEPVRIIHKDQESISAFCLNNVNPGFISLSTPREVQEMDIALLLESPNWMEDECELDILNLNKDSDLIPTTNFLVIQAANDKYGMQPINSK